MNKQEAIKRLEEIEQEEAELEAIINAPDRWQDELVQPTNGDYFVISNNPIVGLTTHYVSNGCNRKPEHAFKTKEQAELIAGKTFLMWEMHQFAHVRNEGWEADWKNRDQIKHGVEDAGNGVFEVTYESYWNAFAFGIAVKSEEIAEEMLEEFGERITQIYNKQY